jgi:hypothetical protein
MSAEASTNAGLYDCRDAFAATLEAMAAEDGRIAAVVNDSVNSTKLKGFRAKFPARFVNVGIAEQNMVGVGAGLANGGMVPFVCSASCFLTARAMEQVKVDLGYARNNVKLCGMSSGMAYGELGPTHHSIEDLAWTRVIPNLTVIVPADPVETRAALLWARDHEGPVFLRLSRLPVPILFDENYTFQPAHSHSVQSPRVCSMPPVCLPLIATPFCVRHVRREASSRWRRHPSTAALVAPSQRFLPNQDRNTHRLNASAYRVSSRRPVQPSFCLSTLASPQPELQRLRSI